MRSLYGTNEKVRNHFVTSTTGGWFVISRVAFSRAYATRWRKVTKIRGAEGEKVSARLSQSKVGAKIIRRCS